jgi:hypothetical protein
VAIARRDRTPTRGAASFPQYPEVMRFGAKASAAFFVAAWMLTGCGRACTDVGATSGVTFDLTRLLANESGHVRVRACVDRTCVQHLASSSKWNTFPVNDPALTSLQSVEVRVVVTDHGRSIFDSTGQAQLHKLQPNGPDCPPTAFAAAVAVTPDGRLMQQPRP